MLFAGTSGKISSGLLLSCVICHSCALRRGSTAKVAPRKGSDLLDMLYHTDDIIFLPSLPARGAAREGGKTMLDF